MTSYPAILDVEPARELGRVQLVLRLVTLALLGLLGIPLLFLTGVLYLALPAVAALWISEHGADDYHRRLGTRLVEALRWFLSLWAWVMFLTDRLAPDTRVRYQVRAEGSPRVGDALLRLITSIPEALVLALLFCASWIVWVVTAVAVLIWERAPARLQELQLGLLRWLGRVIAYHASLVETYPPWSFDTGHEPQEEAP
jgi:hypothetical protein